MLETLLIETVNCPLSLGSAAVLSLAVNEITALSLSLIVVVILLPGANVVPETLDNVIVYVSLASTIVSWVVAIEKLTGAKLGAVNVMDEPLTTLAVLNECWAARLVPF